jgi:hypothetical protein
MPQNLQKMSETTLNTIEIEQFKDAAENARNLTQPSILVRGGVEEIGIKKLTPKQIEQYLWMHPVVPRAIEIKANRMTSRGYRIEPAGSSSQAREAAKEMEDLIENSGGEILINGWIQDTYAFGNGYLTLLPDKETGKTVLLSREHPIFFRIARNKKEQQPSQKERLNTLPTTNDWLPEYSDMKIDPVTKKPSAYTQVIFRYGDYGVEPVGTELTKKQVAHLVFNTWGDEAEGISYVQYVHLLLKYLMNIEEAGAEAIYRSGFTQKKVTTDINSEKDLRKLAKNLERINASDSIILPKGTDVTNLMPGNTQMVEIHDKYLNLIAMRMGIPKPILTLDGTDTNKATMQELMKDMIYDIHADELKIARTIRHHIFKSACETLYGENFDAVPTFKFNDFIEGKEEKATILEITSKYLAQLTDTMVKMQNAGQDDAAKEIFNLIMKNIPEIDMDNTIEKLPTYKVPKKPPMVLEQTGITNGPPTNKGNESVAQKGLSESGNSGAGNLKKRTSRTPPQV